MEIIELKLFDLSIDKIIERKQYSIEINEKYLVSKFEAYIEIKNEEDNRMPSKEEYHYCTTYILKSFVNSIESIFLIKDEIWMLCVLYSGRQEEWKFETESELRSVEKKLLNWWLC